MNVWFPCSTPWPQERSTDKDKWLMLADTTGGLGREG